MPLPLAIVRTSHRVRQRHGPLAAPSPSPGPALARDKQESDPASHLNLYRRMLALRATHRLGEGSLAWVEDYCSETSLAYLNGNTLVIMNVGAEAMPLPAGETILRSSVGEGSAADLPGAVLPSADLPGVDLLGSGGDNLAHGQLTFPPRSSMTGIKDVAERAGLSVATVSRALSGKGNVSPPQAANVPVPQLPSWDSCFPTMRRAWPPGAPTMSAWWCPRSTAGSSQR